MQASLLTDSAAMTQLEWPGARVRSAFNVFFQSKAHTFWASNAVVSKQAPCTACQALNSLYMGGNTQHTLRVHCCSCSMAYVCIGSALAVGVGSRPEGRTVACVPRPVQAQHQFSLGCQSC